MLLALRRTHQAGCATNNANPPTQAHTFCQTPTRNKKGMSRVEVWVVIMNRLNNMLKAIRGWGRKEPQTCPVNARLYHNVCSRCDLASFSLDSLFLASQGELGCGGKCLQLPSHHIRLGRVRPADKANAISMVTTFKAFQVP